MGAATGRIHAYPGIGEAIREALERAFPAREFVVWREPEEFVAGIWQVRWENSAGADDTDELSLPRPLLIRRNRMISG